MSCCRSPPVATEFGESIAPSHRSSSKPASPPRRTRTIYVTMSSIKTTGVEIYRRLETISRSLKKAMQVVAASMSA
jgi:hypothetical protein